MSNHGLLFSDGVLSESLSSSNRISWVHHQLKIESSDSLGFLVNGSLMSCI